MEMGDPVTVGVEMDRIHCPKMAWGLILLTGALYMAGMILRCLLYDRSGLGIYVANSWVYYVLAFVVMIGVCYVDYSRIGEKARELTVGLFLILMAGMDQCRRNDDLERKSLSIFVSSVVWSNSVSLSRAGI